MRTARRRGICTLKAFLLVAVAAVTASVSSSGALAGQDRPARERLEAQVRARFNAVVQRELGLEAAAVARLDAVLSELQEERRELGTRQRQLRRRMASTGSILDGDQAREVLAELVTLQEEELALLRREQDRLLEVLTAPQLVRFYTLRERFADRVRELRRRRPGGGEAREPGPALRR